MKIIIRSLFAFAAAFLAVPTFAQTSPREYSLKIERQPVAAALTDLSKQTGLQIGYFPETLTEDIYIGPLSGRYTPDAAIAQLLLPSGFSFERLNERTIVVTGPELMRSQGHQFSTMKLKVDDDSGSTPSFVRLARLSPAEGPATEDKVQESRGVENARGSRKVKPFELEEVIVTAQRRAERLQDVPMSISVLTGDDLDSSTLTDLNESLRYVPGVVLLEGAYGGTTTIQMRGVVAGAVDTGPNAAAYYVDSLPFGFAKSGFAPSLDSYDLDRVEVFRGPQGTLYGASALSGVVRVLTKNANPNEFELKARGLTSSTQDGGENYRGDVAVNVPIIEGKLAARAVLGYQDMAGWIDKPHDKDANYSQHRNMRLKINAQPTEALSIGLSAWASRSDVGAPSSGDDNGQNSTIRDEFIDTDTDAYGLTIGYEFPRFSITSMTSYLDFANDFDLDLARGDPDFYVHIVETYAAETLAQEVYLASTHEGFWRWTAGAMYRDSKDSDEAVLPPFLPMPLFIQNHSKSYAVFGELTRLFLGGQLELTAGLRYFEDDLTQRELGRWGDVTPDNPLATVDNTFSATTPRFVLTWHPREQMTVYASYSEGFRSGWHQFPGTDLSVPPVKPDHLTNYELGSKGSLWGGRLAFDAALYYIDWQDIQQNMQVTFAGGECCLGAGLNGESASGVGVDFGVLVAPVEALELGLNVSWNDLTMDGDVIDGTGAVLFNQGDRPGGSTEYTLGASVDYVVPMGTNGFEGRFSASANYSSKLAPNPTYAALSSRMGDPLLLGRASVSLQAPDHWTASLFVDNITNEQGAALRDPNTTDFYTRVRPRTVGVQFEYRY